MSAGAGAATVTTDATPEALLARLDLEQKVRLLSGADMWALPAEPAIGLRPVLTSDGPVGVRGPSWDERDTSVLLPSPTALAATWDPDLVHEVAGVLAAQARRKGVDVLLAPTVNLHRSPLGGRHFECFSEDPVLTAEIAVAYVRGLQAGGVAATVKHYVANESEDERFTLDARVDERTLRELYLAPFERLVTEAGTWLVMAAYNRVNGASMTESPLLADPLKSEWRFDGVVVSDWTAVRSTEASAGSALDLAMPGPEARWGGALVAAVREGRVPEATVDDKVLRILRLAARVGALGAEQDRAAANGHARAPVDGRASVAAAARPLLRRAAAAGTVMLRNDGGLLPLDPGALRRVALLGPNAAVARLQGGGSAEVYPERAVTPLDGLRTALGPGVELRHSVGVRTSPRVEALTPALARDPVTGRPGLRARFLDADGHEVASELRLAGRLMWAPSEVPPGSATLEVTARLDATEGGAWTFAVAGTGHHALLVDGTVLHDGDIDLETDDIATLMLAPPEVRATHQVPAGQPVELCARHRVWSAPYGVSVALGADPPHPGADEEFDTAVAEARVADVAVVVVGTTSEVESEGFDRTSLSLPGRQDELVRAVAAANPRTVVVVNSGGPVALPWLDEVPAALLTWFGGQEAGDALADVLTGAAEPGGRLPTTWARAQADVPVLSTTPVGGRLDYPEGLHVGHRAWLRSPAAPAAWFGHGLGYTAWQYGPVDVPAVVAAGEDLRVGVTVTNTGARRGSEVVEVYLARPDSALDRPVRWLAGFARVEADPGDSVTAEVVVAARAFRHWAGGWHVEPGAFDVLVARSAGDVRARRSVAVGTA